MIGELFGDVLGLPLCGEFGSRGNLEISCGQITNIDFLWNRVSFFAFFLELLVEFLCPIFIEIGGPCFIM